MRSHRQALQGLAQAHLVGKQQAAASRDARSHAFALERHQSCGQLGRCTQLKRRRRALLELGRGARRRARHGRSNAAPKR